MSLPEAMKWKYGAKISKGKDGYIDKWEHPSMPKPSREQAEKDLQEFLTYEASKKESYKKDKSSLLTKLNLREDEIKTLKRIINES